MSRDAVSADVPFAGLARVGVVARHTAVLLARDPGPMIGYTLMPVLLMTILRPLYGRLYGGELGLNQLAPGMGVMFALFALKVVGSGMLDERTWKTWDRLASSPASSGEILLGKSLPLLGAVLVQQAVLLGFAAVAFGLRPVAGWAPVLLAGVAWCVTILALGTAAARYARSPAQLSAAGDIVAVAVTCLSGALTPFALLPGWARSVGPFTPGYWGLRAYQHALSGTGLWPAVGVLGGITVVAGVLATVRPAALPHRRPVRRTASRGADQAGVQRGAERAVARLSR